MPRGIKGSGKPKNNTPESDGRRRGRKKGQDVSEAPVQVGEELPFEDLPAHQPQIDEREAGKEAVVAAEPNPEPVAPASIALDQDEELTAAEVELVRRYPSRRIKAGSLRHSGTVPGFGHKRTVTIECIDCGEDRVVATSDLFHVNRCLGCSKAAKKGKKRGAASI